MPGKHAEGRTGDAAAAAEQPKQPAAAEMVAKKKQDKAGEVVEEVKKEEQKRKPSDEESATEDEDPELIRKNVAKIAKNDSHRESSSSSSDSDSGSETDSGSDTEPSSDVGEEDGGDDEDDDDEDDEDATGRGRGGERRGVVRTRNEVPRESLPEPEPWPERVGEDEPLKLVGTLSHDLPDAVVVEGKAEQAPAAPENVLVVKEGGILCNSERYVLGRVDEIFGTTEKPCYMLRYGKSQPLSMAHFRIDQEIYAAVNHCEFVDLRTLLCHRGSDASNRYDEEPDAEELDYSDDEEEALARGLLNDQFVVADACTPSPPQTHKHTHKQEEEQAPAHDGRGAARPRPDTPRKARCRTPSTSTSSTDNDKARTAWEHVCCCACGHNEARHAAKAAAPEAKAAAEAATATPGVWGAA